MAPRLQEELAQEGRTSCAPVFIRIFKESDELELWVENGDGFDLFHTCEIFYFSGFLGPQKSWATTSAPRGSTSTPPTG